MQNSLIQGLFFNFARSEMAESKVAGPDSWQILDSLYQHQYISVIRLEVFRWASRALFRKLIEWSSSFTNSSVW